jgi:Arc/MetJ-type ribon-helix-helix transcriptional regulator
LMARVKVNLKLDEGIVKEVERLVEQGYFSNKTEAFMKALQLLLRVHENEEVVKRFNCVREETENMPSLTKAVIESHEEEDEI